MDHQRALDQHAIRSQQPQLLLLGHGGELFLQVQRFIQQAAGVEEFLKLQAADLVPMLQFLVSGVAVLDMPVGIFDALGVQPSFSLLAGGAGRVLDK